MKGIFSEYGLLMIEVIIGILILSSLFSLVSDTGQLNKIVGNAIAKVLG